MGHLVFGFLCKAMSGGVFLQLFFYPFEGMFDASNISLKININGDKNI